MARRWGTLVLILVSAGPRAPLVAQSSGRTDVRPIVAHGARTLVYHPRDLIALRAKLHYTTLIVLPEGEDVVEATCGDKEFWIVNARGPLVSVKPAKAGSETNLNLVTTSGQVYAFLLTEVSETKQDPDLTVYLEVDEWAGAALAHERPKYVPAQQVEDFRAQAELAREDARRATAAARVELEQGLTAFRNAYPLTLAFPYRFKADTAPFFVHAIFHDDHRTFIQARARELPSLYELKDGAPNLVNFEVHDGTYVVPTILDSGYLMLGKQRLGFQRVDAR
jgi:type IV secretory pathway VirB9-like protein